MRKSIKNKELVELAKKGKAKYSDGSVPKAIETVQDTYRKVQATMQDMSAKLSKEVDGGNAAVLSACDVIIESMKLYHEAVVTTLANQPAPAKPVQLDTKKLDSINDRLLAVLTAVTDRPPKEWDFDVKYDWKGKFERIVAKEIKH